MDVCAGTCGSRALQDRRWWQGGSADGLWRSQGRSRCNHLLTQQLVRYKRFNLVTKAWSCAGGTRTVCSWRGGCSAGGGYSWLLTGSIATLSPGPKLSSTRGDQFAFLPVPRCSPWLQRSLVLGVPVVSWSHNHQEPSWVPWELPGCLSSAPPLPLSLLFGFFGPFPVVPWGHLCLCSSWILQQAHGD